jgi:hypothetical protein
MITMPLETLALIIDKARESQALAEDLDEEVEEEEEDELAEEEAASADEEAEEEVDDEFDEDEDEEELDEEELEELLSDLSEDELAELAALAWIGSGEFEQGSWQEALSAARAKAEDQLIDDLLATAALGDLIERGLVSLGYKKITADRE